MTGLSAFACISCRAFHLQVSEPVAGGIAVGQLVDVPFGSFPCHRSDPIRDAWIRIEAGRALLHEASHG